MITTTTTLPAYLVQTESGHTWITCMARGVTLLLARAYFIGQKVNIAPGTAPEKMERVTAVWPAPTKPYTIFSLRAHNPGKMPADATVSKINGFLAEFEHGDSPRPGDLIRYTNELGRVFEAGRLAVSHYMTPNELTACGDASTPPIIRVASESGLFQENARHPDFSYFCSQSGGPWLTVKRERLILVGRQAVAFNVWDGRPRKDGCVQFDGQARVWEYTAEPEKNPW